MLTQEQAESASEVLLQENRDHQQKRRKKLDLKIQHLKEGRRFLWQVLFVFVVAFPLVTYIDVYIYPGHNLHSWLLPAIFVIYGLTSLKKQD